MTVIGLVRGRAQVVQNRVLNNPFAKSIWIGHPFETFGRIDEQVVTELRDSIESIDCDGKVSIYPFRILNLTIRHNGFENMVIGRTITTDEPIMDGLGLSSELTEKYLKDGIAGLIASPMLIERLGLPRNCKEVEVWHKSRKEFVTVGIAHVLDTPIPSELEFLVSGVFWDEFNDAVLEDRCAKVATGEIEITYFESELPDKVFEIASDHQTSVEKHIFQKNDNEDGLVLHLATNGDPNYRTKKQWRSIVSKLGEQFEFQDSHRESFNSEIKFFDSGELTSSSSGDDRVRANDMMSVYVTEISDLHSVVDAAEKIPVLDNQVNKDVLNQLTAADTETKSATRIVSLFLGIVISFAFANVLTMQILRNYFKTRDSGLLLCLGFSKFQLLLLIALRSFSQSIPSIMLGTILGNLVGRRLSNHFYETVNEVKLGFSFTYEDAIFLSVAIVVLLLVFSISSSWHWFARSPARLLKTEN